MVFPESDDPDASQSSMELAISPAYSNNTIPAGTVFSVAIYARNKYGVLLDSIDTSKFNIHVQNNPNLAMTAGYDSKGEFYAHEYLLIYKFSAFCQEHY